MIIKSATFDRAPRKADRAVSLHFTTALEQSPDELKEFDEALGSCIIAIKPNETEFDYNDLNQLDSVDIAMPEKSSAKRLKNVLWILQKQELGRKPEPDEEKEFYRLKMETVIEHFKMKLNHET